MPVIIKSCQMLNETSNKRQRLLTCCQNGEISPNLVTLRHNLEPPFILHQVFQGEYVDLVTLLKLRVAAIAPWFRLRLPSCGPGFDSQALHLYFFQFVLLELCRENNENKKTKSGRDWPFFKKKTLLKLVCLAGPNVVNKFQH